MKNQTILVWRGFDLFFRNVSQAQLQAIAEDLGGNSSYDFVEQRATYMCEERQYIPLNRVHEVHAVVRSVGRRMAATHGGECIANELYLGAENVALPEIRRRLNVVSEKRIST